MDEKGASPVSDRTRRSNGCSRSWRGCAIRRPAANGTASRLSRRSRPTRSRKPMRSPTRSSAATWRISRTSSATCCSRSSSMPAWPRKPAHSTFDDVAAAIADKMERRHPHIFGDAAEGGHHLLGSRSRPRSAARRAHASALDGVALALPALLRAEKLQKRAARTGFDWPDPERRRAKIDEELAEVERPRPTTSARRKSATCSSPWSIGRASSASTRKPRCAPPMRSSSGASGRWRLRPARLSPRSLDEQEALWQRSAEKSAGCQAALDDRLDRRVGDTSQVERGQLRSTQHHDGAPSAHPIGRSNGGLSSRAQSS